MMLENHMVKGNADHDAELTPAQREVLKEAAHEDAVEKVCSGYWDDLPVSVRTSLNILMQYVNDYQKSRTLASEAIIAGAARAVFDLAVADETQRIMEE